uniref:Uncharacterized protein n=1 Tax=Micrurus carvalhoi TaxID=3147026 RepID=A0A2H6N9P8_9SAUR
MFLSKQSKEFLCAGFLICIYDFNIFRLLTFQQHDGLSSWLEKTLVRLLRCFPKLDAIYPCSEKCEISFLHYISYSSCVVNLDKQIMQECFKEIYLFIYLFIYTQIYILSHLPKDSGR